MKLPDFFIIGAAKAGTTSLYAILERHPQVYVPEIKEPEFFARDERYAGGIGSYAQAFERAQPGQRIGEASTLYSLSPLFPRTAERIRKHAPDARLIYVMRQPVDRAYSYYVQLTKNRQNSTGDLRVHRTFEEFVVPEKHAVAAPTEQALAPFDAHLPDVPELCLAGSEYVLQIEAYLKHFDREQMLFLKFEDFRRDQVGLLRKITDFLEIDPLDDAVFRDEGTVRNVSSTHFSQVAETRKLTALRERLGPVWKLREIVPEQMRNRIRDLALAKLRPVDRAHVPPPMEPTTQRELTVRYAKQLDRLSELTGLSFDDWALR